VFELSLPFETRARRLLVLPAPVALLGLVALWTTLLLACSGSTEDDPRGLSDVREAPDTGVADRGSADEGNAEPTECRSDIDCFDENPCTVDRCVGGTCAYEPDDRPPTQIVGNCRREICSGGELLLVMDDTDVPADDGFECTEIFCQEGVLVVVADNFLCDDGDRCNGIEICDLAVGCRPGQPVDFDEDGIPDMDELPEDDPPDIDGDGITDCADWETCDGLDNDRNGLVDDDPEDEELGEPCYEGPEGTEGVGACSPGVFVCRGGRIVCDEQVVPLPYELCDGLDNDCDGEVPAWEIASFCRRSVTFDGNSAGPELMLTEMSTALRAVDVHFNIDTTGSMSGVLNTLRQSLQTEIVPGVAQVIPDVAFGVSTFEDYPLYNFGSPGDLPFELWQRITTSVDLVQDALGRIDLGSGNDLPESGIESLYQIATGAGTRWRRSGSSSSLDPSAYRGWLAEIDPRGDIDYYRIDAPAGAFMTIEIVAARAGSPLDSLIELYDAMGNLLGRSDDAPTYGTDSRLDLVTSGTPPYYLRVSGRSTSTTGWYFASVTSGAVGAMAPAESTCRGLEVGGEFFAGAGDAVALAAFDEVTPRAEYVACFEDCVAEVGDVRARPWIRTFCFAGGTPTCGDGVPDPYEECDDGNRHNGDGCSDVCNVEADGVPPFNPRVGYDPALGHGTRGGVGFRENALPIIVHATDARSHDQADYLARDPRIEAHGTEVTFQELEKLGARIVGLTTRDPANAPITDLLNPPGMSFATRALVPPCAFDGSAPRERDVGNVCTAHSQCFSRQCVPGNPSLPLSSSNPGTCRASCFEGECCVGIRGAGQAPPAGAGGLCPLTFEMELTGSGLTDGVVRGIQALVRFATYRVTPVLRDHPENPRDARCFVHGIEVAEVIVDDECVPELEFLDRNGDGLFESIANVTPQSRVVYALTVENRDRHDLDGDLDTLEPCGPPGTYRLTLDVVGDDVVVLSSVVLEFVIAE
jgi:cysteine-rich repeat protein